MSFIIPSCFPFCKSLLSQACSYFSSNNHRRENESIVFRLDINQAVLSFTLNTAFCVSGRTRRGAPAPPGDVLERKLLKTEPFPIKEVPFFASLFLFSLRTVPVKTGTAYQLRRGAQRVFGSSLFPKRLVGFGARPRKGGARGLCPPVSPPPPVRGAGPRESASPASDEFQ